MWDFVINVLEMDCILKYKVDVMFLLGKEE